MTATSAPAHSSGTFQVAGKTIHRLGFGAMRITGDGVWGPPADHDESIRVLRRALELGVDFIDTADSYGPNISEELIREALYPYPDDLVIATKAGFVRTGPNEWHTLGEPHYLRQEVELSLRRLGLERIELMQLHRIDDKFPLADQIGELKALQDEGKIGDIGLSEVSTDQIEAAKQIATIATVQNQYNLVERQAEDVLDYCADAGIGFIPWNPIQRGDLAAPGGPVDEIAKATGATPSQVALAWLLARSPVMLPIPGTSSVEHLEENLEAATLSLTEDQVAELTKAR